MIITFNGTTSNPVICIPPSHQNIEKVPHKTKEDPLQRARVIYFLYGKNTLVQ